MKIKLDPANPKTWPKGQINAARLDATTEAELTAQQADDNRAERDVTETVATNYPRDRRTSIMKFSVQHFCQM